MLTAFASTAESGSAKKAKTRFEPSYKLKLFFLTDMSYYTRNSRKELNVMNSYP